MSLTITMISCRLLANQNRVIWSLVTLLWCHWPYHANPSKCCYRQIPILKLATRASHIYLPYHRYSKPCLIPRLLHSPSTKLKPLLYDHQHPLYDIHLKYRPSLPNLLFRFRLKLIWEHIKSQQYYRPRLHKFSCDSVSTCLRQELKFILYLRIGLPLLHPPSIRFRLSTMQNMSVE